jgi:hypothetical protein
MDWQPIETAPKDGAEFLAYWDRATAVNGNLGMAVTCWYDYGGGMMGWYGAGPNGIVLTGATHWMPLPEPPK